ncbi:hypothetical protein RAB80_014053 [Fusarium oxysporum f. sp. vasinfectum]|uniref:Uncharacterized protein n=1 Tax=Fusarium oxysporum f. sp. vasinfectum 25433 TaxID=1089449 RepID=X0KJS7_FUSOX|nr:hypothetical protein FOTG_17797 [Fusarium oxysporum f. sp. vasinfectum 25433]KAK2669916.1 hypothetical protein RAB80_014053 [Fusarium oxysporum f. sp. vasinfectum]KAK2923164.1 hypothetical protein FoTM2_016686 [Fusarium oxysporum f. sp. vasinfectum]
MTARHSPAYTGAHQPHPLSIQNMVHPEENQRLSSDSNTMAQQYKLIPATSMCINPAVLHFMDVPPEKNLHPKPEMCQRGMTGKRQHNQERQEPGQFIPAPICELE